MACRNDKLLGLLAAKCAVEEHVGVEVDVDDECVWVWGTRRPGPDRGTTHGHDGAMRRTCRRNAVAHRRIHPVRKKIIQILWKDATF